MDRTRISIAKPDIIACIDKQAQSVFKKSELTKILSRHRANWRLAEATTGKDFVAFLCDKAYLQEIQLPFPSREEIRYIWRQAADYEVALSLREHSYLSHFTAVYLHGLTEAIPKTIYVNFEQKKKPTGKSGLTQDGIDAAFGRAHRLSKSTAEYNGKTICILNGKNTGEAGVEIAQGPSGETIRTTCVERTLIDIAVRPAYAGGVNEILQAYIGAKDKVSVNYLCAILKTANYIYPYHQAIGFLMERAGYDDADLRLLEKIDMKYDFYLAYQMRDKEYSKRWRLYYPKGL